MNPGASAERGISARAAAPRRLAADARTRWPAELARPVPVREHAAELPITEEILRRLRSAGL